MMMTKCIECGHEMRRYIKPEHMEDLGGVIVRICGAVIVDECPKCGEMETTIPDMTGLVAAAALLRALDPARLGASDLKFIRRALGMTQLELSKHARIDKSTISRWENGSQGQGEVTEMNFRHNVSALLRSKAPAIEYDPVEITRMHFKQGKAAPLSLERETVRTRHERFRGWNEPFQACA